MTNKNNCKKTTFTFMEVLIAVAILAISLTMILNIMAHARNKILKAEKRWGREHLLSSLCELYLLSGPETEIPENLLPDGFTATCTLQKVDNLPEDTAEPNQGWVLARFHITLTGASGDLLGEKYIEKIVLENDCN